MASALGVFVLCLASGLMISVNGDCEGSQADCGCPLGWSRYNNRCFLFESTEKEWSDAERHCTLLDGNLASLQTSGEFTFIRALIHKATNEHKQAWIGGYDAPKTTVWLWSDGSQFKFRGWGPGEPNDHKGGEGCMEMNLRGLHVNDAKCNRTRPFVCALTLHQST